MRKVKLEELERMKGNERLIIPHYSGPVYIVRLQSIFSPDRFDRVIQADFKPLDSYVVMSYNFSVGEYNGNIIEPIYYYDPYELPIYELGV